MIVSPSTSTKTIRNIENSGDFFMKESNHSSLSLISPGADADIVASTRPSARGVNLTPVRDFKSPIQGYRSAWLVRKAPPKTTNVSNATKSRKLTVMEKDPYV